MPITRFSRITAVLFLLLQSGLSSADDTEIFLSHGKSDVNPNVILLLDDSYSMQWCPDKDFYLPEWTCPNGNTRISRMKILKSTLDTVLRDMQDINLGLMTLNKRGSLEVAPIGEVREKARNIVKGLQTDGLTPVATRLYDAARYISGFPTNHRGSYTGHSAFPAIDNHKAPSPIKHACQPTHLVLVTDGDAYGGNAPELIKTLTGKKSCRWPSEPFPGAKECVAELVEWLHTEDQHPEHEGAQTVTTHTIGFALGALPESGVADPNKSKGVKAFLKEVAELGGGSYHTAENADELYQAFKEILQKSSDIESACFVNPAAAVGNSLRNTDQLYYALFKPTISDRWAGNLKRYRLGSQQTTKDGKILKQTVILDAKGIKATDDNDGSLLNSAQSFWSTQPDGNDISQGGAAWQLPERNKRNLFVETNGSLGELKLKNQAISNALLDARDNLERLALLNYIRGFADDGSPRSKALGDLLHSAPVLFSYGKAQSDQVAIVGTNEGFVHLFNRQTGIEEFAFMPGELLKNIKVLKANQASTIEKPHPYGVDNTVTVWQEETKNKQIKHTYAYITLRRGGRGIYALDITERKQPKLLWKIDGTKDRDFQRLGQTWSRPVKTKINIGGNKTDVLIFAGGYDPSEDNFNQDKDAYRSNEALGNAIYIVHAKTGKKLWSASRKHSNLNLVDMIYSIPATVRVLDIDKDGLADQLFVGDTGGQIWRLFIHNGKWGNTLVSASGFTRDMPLAKLGKNTPQHARRFYHEADAALDKNSKKHRLLLNIGSGYRAHPLNTRIKDRFYSLHLDLTNSIHKPLMESDLHRATRDFDNFDETSSITAIERKNGWYMPLSLGQGEKVLSTSLTANGEVFFNTYVPSNQFIGCQVVLGKNYTYRVRTRSAAPPVKFLDKISDGASTTTVLQDLYHPSPLIGIAGDVGTALLDGQLFVIAAGEFTPINSSPCDTPKGCKTFWMDFKG